MELSNDTRGARSCGKQLEATQHRAISRRAIRGCTERHRGKQTFGSVPSVQPRSASVTQSSFPNLRFLERKTGTREHTPFTSNYPEFSISNSSPTDTDSRLARSHINNLLKASARAAAWRPRQNARETHAGRTPRGRSRGCEENPAPPSGPAPRCASANETTG